MGSVLLGLIIAFASMAEAQERPASLAGTWQLISQQAHDETGQVNDIFGPNPHGQLMYDAAGNMSVQLFRSDRHKFASGDRLRGTYEEVRSAYEGSIAYYGTYTTDQASGRVTHHVLGATFPNWVGTDFVRHYKVEGQRLTLTSAPLLLGGKKVTTVNVFERMK